MPVISIVNAWCVIAIALNRREIIAWNNGVDHQHIIVSLQTSELKEIRTDDVFVKV